MGRMEYKNKDRWSTWREWGIRIRIDRVDGENGSLRIRINGVDGENGS